MKLQAIILAGGLGTRLRSEVKSLPKVMAPVNNRPFIEYLLDDLKSQGFSRVILAVGYMADTIIDHFGNEYCGMKLVYSIEKELLGTGGGIRQALSLADKTDPCFVLNGDTYLKVDYKEILTTHNAHSCQLSMTLRYVEDVYRYGAIKVDDNGIVTAFCEKGDNGPGYINAGTYLMSTDIFANFDLPEKFSLETDFIATNIAVVKPVAYLAEGKFIDIGIPEDFHRVQTMLK
ncbi:MAG: NTP transferase domain-containing protein [Lentisphaerae bacterium]|nr:NTP transferase domain-containing protein [Lentisphaerota bacterium]MCP4100096.1 NTP transferase domain-containing protein [Lentisphaerota bacterium]